MVKKCTLHCKNCEMSTEGLTDMLIAIPLRLFCRGVKNKVIKASQKSERIANMGLAHAIAVLDTLYERHVGKNKFIRKQ